MAIFKCKMCGGDLNVAEGLTVCECEYCGTKQTVPSVDNEKKLNLFNRANRLRINGEFDKAAAIYESIVAEFPEEAEGYWGLVICNYGIEYVDDPATANKIPTCHRASFEPITNDESYKMALEYADITAQKVYRDEAREIDRIREEILAVSKNEKPYDIFICYKETDEKGDRTVDSVIAQDVYDALTAKGYRVFFSRISLEEKLGRQYEPYIFAALNSAKIMLSFGTKYEYFHAVWVKNEWSRFLKLMAKDKTKLLIPCYKDMDAYDMPDEFKALQAQDMGKVGAVQDLIRGIDKLLQKDTPAKETVVVQQTANNPTVDTLLERAFMFLEDGKWQSADEYCEKVLDIDPKNAIAYIGKLMVELKVKNRADIFRSKTPLAENSHFARALQFAGESLASELNQYISQNKDYIEELCEQERQALIRQKQEQEAAKQTLQKPRILAQRLENLVCGSLNGIICIKEDGKLVAAGSRANKNLKELNGKYFIGLYGDRYGVTADGCVYNIDYPYNYDLIAQYDNISYFYCDVSYNPAMAVTNKEVVFIAAKNLPTEICDEVIEWQGIVKVAYGTNGENPFVVALTEQGGILIAGKVNPKISTAKEWTDITDIAVCDDVIMGLKKDGTVVAVGNNKYGKLDVSNWTDIVSIYTDGLSTIGVKSDGTVVAAGCNDDGKLNLSGWTDILTVCKHYGITYGLRKDGRVLVAGEYDIKTDHVKKWRDVVSIHRFCHGMVGILSDGTVVCAPDDYEDSDSENLNVSDFELFDSIDTLVLPIDSKKAEQIKNDAVAKRQKEQEHLEEKRRIEKEEKEKQQQIIAERRSKNLCQHCGGTFKGLFTKKCSSCGKEKDY